MPDNTDVAGRSRLRTGLDTGETGSDSFQYIANDGTGNSNIATVNITINGVNDVPVAAADTNWAKEDASNASGNVLQTQAHPGDPSAVLTFSDMADTDPDEYEHWDEYREHQQQEQHPCDEQAKAYAEDQRRHVDGDRAGESSSG